MNIKDFIKKEDLAKIKKNRADALKMGIKKGNVSWDTGFGKITGFGTEHIIIAISDDSVLIKNLTWAKEHNLKMRKKAAA